MILRGVTFGLALIATLCVGQIEPAVMPPAQDAATQAPAGDDDWPAPYAYLHEIGLDVARARAVLASTVPASLRSQ